MAEAFLEEIYDYAMAISALRQSVEYLRVEDVHHAKLCMEKFEPNIRRACNMCMASGCEGTSDMGELFLYIYQRVKDNTVRADMMESIMIPTIEKCVQNLGIIEQQVDEEFQLESTACGFLTIKNLQMDYYLHSNNNPMEEARKQIEYSFVPSVEEYAVLGCGLGYQVYQLYLISNGSVKIYLYEQDAQVVDYARKYGVLDWIPEDMLEICTEDVVYSFLMKADADGVGAYIHGPSTRLIKDEVERNAMRQALMEQYTPYVHKRDNLINFYRNMNSGAMFIRDLDKSIFKNEAVVVAAGPSLDDCLEKIREWQGKKTIIAVGTVFAKLLKLGIRPDFVMVMDPQKRTLKQLEGYFEEEVPLILDGVAYWEFARKYKGPKYLVLTPQCQEIFDCAMSNGIDMWPSGGTVTSFAVEMALKFRAEKIYLAGVDLAYPGGLSHASDTMDRQVKTFDNMRQIPGVMGQTVYTTTVFAGYLQWLENRIESFPQIKWYNMSTKGARIQGTVEIGDQLDTIE